MAAVTTSPPPAPSSPGSPVRRKPIPLRELTPDRYEWEENGKPLPSVPLGESPRLRQSPVSPVKVEFQPEDWARPSNANIETAAPYQTTGAPSISDRSLPRTPQAPTPPPHTPVAETFGSGTVPSSTSTVRTLSRTSEHTSTTNLRPADPDSSEVSPGRSKEAASPEPEVVSVSDGSRTQDEHRHSRDSDVTASTSQQQASTGSSATTSTSSISGPHESSDVQENVSPESSIIEDINQPVPQLQYHHQAFLPRTSSISALQDARTQSNPDLIENAANINRHLTPNSHFGMRSSIPRPQSAYSAYSDVGPRGRSPGFHPGASHIRAPSAHSRRSPETRLSSYAELLNVPYPQPAPAPITLDNSQLRNVVGSNASLLSTQKTLEMYRQNVKKTNDPSIQYSFAVFLIATAQEQGLVNEEPAKKNGSGSRTRDRQSPQAEATGSSPTELVREARAILQKLSNNGYPFAQYYLADGYASGLFSKGKEDYNSAFPLFVLAAKHGHAESAYRAALCYEFGWGCRKDPAKAVLFLRTAASKRHPGAMTRLGKACLSGDLGEKRYREGIKWLKLAAEAADTVYNAAPYHLGCLYETGYGDDIFKDESYAAELFTQAADLGHPEANYRMGDAYEHGKLNCPRDPALSVHFYTGAAERGHAAAMMGLCAWYMVGAEPLLEKDEEEAYEWARRSAELGYVKAQYAVGYFTEMGIGCRRDILEANVWYVKAADAGDERAKQRLAAIRAAASGGTPMEVGPPRNGKIKKAGEHGDKECVVM
ncbi:hypothetical protein VTK73DRAFT_6221 [Phialemonium thermophilum]|uniref:Chitin synthase activator n=1 Tax=Phialemonium thermophilum TaxID=223376 RepID=A0ABR3XX09_9PEZI